MAWIMTNPNPKGKLVGDCTVRALSIVTGKDWHDTYFGLALEGAMMCDMPSANTVTTSYLRRNGFRRCTIPNDCPQDYSVADFCADHPSGVYVLGIGSHVVAVVNGDYWDSWDSGRETPVYYFAREE